MQRKNNFTVVSLFSGCGGSSLGYQLAGGKVLMAAEWDDNAVETYKLNFPETPIYHGDICKLSVEDIFRTIGLCSRELDVLDGSPPCQGFSTVGKRKFSDNRNQLFKEYIRILKGLQPKVFIMENVSGMVKGKMKILFADILKALRDTPYSVRAMLLNAKHYNVPQSRERMIFIGVRNDLSINPTFPIGTTREITVREAFEGIEDYEDRPMKPWLKKALVFIKPLDSTKHTKQVFMKFKGTTGSAISLKVLAWDKPSPTVTKSEIAASGLVHPNKHRYLNLDELKALCSFPKDFQFTDRSHGVERLGNAVMPNFMKAIALHVNEHILGKINGEEIRA